MAQAAPGWTRRAHAPRLRWLQMLPPLLLLLLLPGVPALPPPPTKSGGPNVNVKAEQNGESCGASDPHHKDRYFGAEIHACGRLLSTNCSVTYEPMKCPPSCPFIAPNHAFACLFSCAQANKCWEGNPDRPFADKKMKSCMPCGIYGCRYCDTTTTCIECHDDFVLKTSEDGTHQCVFWMDKDGMFEMISMALAVLVGTLIVLGVIWGCCCGGHPEADVNAYAIFRARRHRHMCKTLWWQLSNKRSAVDWVNPGFNVHKKNICGVGLALFYNSVLFTILFSLIVFSVTYMVYERSGVQAALSNFDEEPSDLYWNGLVPRTGAPSVVVSRLYVCAGEDQAHLKDTIAEFATANFYGMGVLWLILFCVLFVFAKQQKVRAAVFNSQNATMADYALRVTGLPKDLVDEADLREWLEGVFRKACPGKFSRPPEVEDGGKLTGDVLKDRNDTPIEVFGVSICYDYLRDWGPVDDILMNMNMRLEVEDAKEANASPVVPEKYRRHLTAKHIGGEEYIQEQVKKDREQVRKWFEGSADERLKTNGEAFCVFNWHDDLERVLEVWEGRETDNTLKGLTHPKNPDELIQLHVVYSEPPSVNWQFLGTPLTVKAVVKGFAWIACLILFILLGILFPYWRGILKPYGRLGSVATGTKTAIMGQLIGGLNTIVQIQIWMTSFNVGFHRRENMDRMILACNVILQFLNIGFSILVTFWQAYNLETDPHPMRDFVSLYDLEPIATENRVAEGTFMMMMPGFFFVGNVVMLIMAGVWPWIFNNFLAKVIYVWRAMPWPVLKVLRVVLPWAPDDLGHYPHWRAERALEPMEIQIGDYANLIVIPSVCMTSLFAMSPYTSRIFKWMLVWAAVYYFFLRYLHLRFCKKCYYTSNNVDNCVNILWGIPLSIVAAAWCQWGCRAEILFPSLRYETKFAMVCLTFGASFGIWTAAYLFGVKPWRDDLMMPEEEELNVLEVKENLFYSWFNCNPVFVLKCAFLWHDDEGNEVASKRKQHPIACGEDPTKVRFYQIGKEYLFLKPERQHLAFPAHWNKGWPGGALEFETYLEMALDAVTDLFAKLCKPRETRVMDDKGDFVLAKQLLDDGCDGCLPNAASKRSLLAASTP